jgi:hypothetical protein
LDFLGLWLIRLESPDYEPWICLDFLGFSRAKRDLSMGYEGQIAKNFLVASPPGGRSVGTERHDSGLWKVGLLMQQAYPKF